MHIVYIHISKNLHKILKFSHYYYCKLYGIIMTVHLQNIQICVCIQYNCALKNVMFTHTHTLSPTIACYFINLLCYFAKLLIIICYLLIKIKRNGSQTHTGYRTDSGL